MKRRKTKKVEMVNVMGFYVAKGGKSYRNLMILKRDRDKNFPHLRNFRTNRRRGLRRNIGRKTVSKAGLIKFIEDTYYNDKILAENKRWLNRILGKIKKLKPKVYDIQSVQNYLRDLRDEDPADDDNYWYLIIDAITDATGIAVD